MSPIITSDVMLSRIFFATEEGYCSIEADSDSTTSQIAHLLFALVFVAQMFAFGTGMVLYLMVSRSFCEFKGTDVKVCLALVSTAGLSGVLFIASLLLIDDHSTSIPLLLGSVGTLAEQFILLITLCKKAIMSSSEEFRSCKNSLQGCVRCTYKM